MPGMAPISLQQFMNPTTGRPYAGARAAFYEASTNTPITVYSDYGLGTEHPNPVLADAYGRFPAIFIDEDVEFYRLRLTTSTGSVLPLGESGSFDIPVLPVIGPTTSGGGGSEVPVDPNAILTTGDVIWVPKTGTRAGFVRMNGRTIGSASSGASERANADTEDLYSYVWSNFSDTICAVTGGRGVSAAADFAANKPIATLDMRRRGPFGLGDMGNSDLGFTGITFDKGNSTTAGSSLGAPTKAITQANLPSVTLTTTIAAGQGSHTHTATTDADNGSGVGSGYTGGSVALIGATVTVNAATLPEMTGTTPLGGSGTELAIMPAAILGTFLWKL